MRDEPGPAKRPATLTRRTALAGAASTVLSSATVMSSGIVLSSVKSRHPSDIGERLLALSSGDGFFGRQAKAAGANSTSVALLNAATGSVVSGVNAVSLFAQRSGPVLVDSVVSTDGSTTVRTVTSFISGVDGRIARVPGDELRIEHATELYGVVEQVLSPQGQFVALYCESPQLTSARGTKANPVSPTGVVRSCVSVYSVAQQKLVATFLLPTEQTFTAGTGGCLSWDPTGTTLHLFVTRYSRGVVNAVTYTLGFHPSTGTLNPLRVIRRRDPTVPLSTPQTSQMTFTSGDQQTVVAVRGNVLYAYDPLTGSVVHSSEVTPTPMTRTRPLHVDVVATPDHRYVLTVDRNTGAVSVYDSAHRRFTHRSKLQVTVPSPFRSVALIPNSDQVVVADPGPGGGALVISLPNFSVLDRLATGTRVSSVATAANRIVLKHHNDAAVTTYPAAGGRGSTISVPATLTSVL